MTAPFKSATPDHWNNLLWAVSSPDIAADFPLPWLPQERRHRLLQFFSSPETGARLRPELELSLQNLKNRRLGSYFEQLWAFVFSHHPDYQLLARNLPIRSADKTLGELDFVLRYLPDNAIEHWEVAVKFYLQVDEFWVGPGLRDRLDIKLAHMREHQLPVAHSTAAVAALAQAGCLLDRQWALMPGRLFTAISDRGNDVWWTDVGGFQRQFSSKGWHWLALPKQAWLASINAPDQLPAIPETADLTQSTTRGPVCVAGFQGTAELSRGFIVPDHWLAHARQQFTHD